MKLLLLIPNFVLMAIAGYNLVSEFEKAIEPNYLLFKLLHTAVLLITIVFTVAIVRSVFVIRDADMYESGDLEYNEMEMQHY